MQVVQQHDGTFLKLSKLHADYDPTDRAAAMAYIQHHHNKGEVLTGLLYLEEQTDDLHANLNTVRRPAEPAGRTRTLPRLGEACRTQRGLSLRRWPANCPSMSRRCATRR